MTSKQIYEGLRILDKYRDGNDHEVVTATPDMIVVEATDHEILNKDLLRMLELGWSQSCEPGTYDLTGDWYCLP